MRILLFVLTTLFLTTFATSGCKSAQKQIESGNYDAAINHCVKNLAGKKKKKDDLVVGLERAFERAQERDLNRLEAYQRTNTIDSWDKAYDIAVMIQKRQEKVSPLMPLRSQKGYRARFDMVDAQNMVSQAREKSCQLRYVAAEGLLSKADREGDRASARDAYYVLEDLEKKYGRGYRDCQHLMSNALRLGATNIAFSVSNQTDQIIPMSVENDLLTLSARDMNTLWRKFDTSTSQNASAYQYRARFILEDIQISPEFVRENRYTDEADIKDGWEYVLDKLGNVRKDSTGRDIRRDKMVRVRADILEMNQRKTARVLGTVKIFDESGKRLLDSCPISTEVVFDHVSMTFRGDERALSDRTRCNLGRTPVPFPTHRDLMQLAANQLHPQVSEALRSTKAIY
jgi:hypothetical protein